MKRTLLLVSLISITSAWAQTNSADSFPVEIRVQADKSIGQWKPIWRFFGYDEPNFTYMKDGKKLLSELAQLNTPVYIRAHHLLTSGDGTPGLKWGSTGIYEETPEGKPVYNFTIVDRIVDTYLERNLKPLVELGFMPRALSTRPDLYPTNPPPNKRVEAGAGFSYPPKDYAKWGELCYAWAKHCVEKYGANEVASWYWEVWNEPNISYWKGTPEGYHKLYDFAIEGVRRALPTARVGGPHTAGGPGGNFLKNFLEHCIRGTNFATGRVGSPLDFVAFHAKGSPRVLQGNVTMGIANQLRDIDNACAVIAGFPELKGKPVIIGESDPEGCAACPSTENPANGYRNTTLYAAYTAATFTRKQAIAARHGVNLEGAVTWAFEFENQPYFAGFRALSSNGIDLPVLNTFRMLAKLGTNQVAAESSAAISLEDIIRTGVRGAPDVNAVATKLPGGLAVMAWHYHDTYVPGPTADLSLLISGLPEKARQVTVAQYLIDDQHSNAFEAWKRIGSPQQPTAEQYAELERSGQLTLARNEDAQVQGGAVRLRCVLPRQAVVLYVLKVP